jgi:hypothetical protein
LFFHFNVFALIATDTLRCGLADRYGVKPGQVDSQSPVQPVKPGKIKIQYVVPAVSTPNLVSGPEVSGEHPIAEAPTASLCLLDGT